MKYEEYKDSGVEWIGEVPSHWGIHRFKNFTSLQTEASNNENKIGLENIEGKTGRYIESTSEFEGDGVGFNIGDIVYGKLRPYLQKVWLATFAGNAVGDFFVFKAMQNCYNKYLFYVMVSDGFTAICNGATIGAKMPRVSSGFIRGLHFFLPPLSEQHAIADYLDVKCGEINRAIDVQKKKIDLLNELKQTVITNTVTKGLNPNAPMKDSGVEWIGEVPEHWEVMKLNFACNKITDFVASGSFADLRSNVTYLDEPDYAMLIRTADLSGKDKNVAKVYITKHSYHFLSNSNLFGGEVILPNIGASIGDVYIMPNNMHDKTSLGPNSIMLISKTDNKFLFYLLCSKRWKEALILLGQAAAQSKFNKTDLRALKAIIPPIQEQQAIVAHIEKEVEKIDAQIFKANRKIELLDELKQSIITEAVTGKIKVFNTL
jgi:type I restriction enzyme S subunit